MPGKVLVCVDPLAKEGAHQQHLLRNWRTFLKKMDCGDLDRWTVLTMQHNKQEDSSSCGVLVLMFAEAFLQSKNISYVQTSFDAVNTARRKVACALQDKASRHSREVIHRETAFTRRAARDDEEEGKMAFMSNKDRLSHFRPALVKRTSEPTLKGLLLGLEAYKPPVLSSIEVQNILQKTSVLQDQVTSLIDMVLNKGDTACGIMLSLLKELDYYFYQDILKKTQSLSEDM